MLSLQDRVALFWRDIRHSPCLMTPLSFLMIFTFSALSLIGLVFQFPSFVLGLLMSPLTRRMQWLVEFIYPYSIARWGHFFLIKSGTRQKCGVILGDTKGTDTPLHSRSIEQRIEVVKGRVYIHPLPQLLDNVGYLIVCTPPIMKPIGGQKSLTPIIGILVDVGDADSVLHQVDLIQGVHYACVGHAQQIEIHAVLCTHKHHDHTAGNKSLITRLKNKIEIYGGAVERVPFQSKYVKDSSFINLPSVGNNVPSELFEIECISVPSHTRGSIVYALRNKPFVNKFNQASVENTLKSASSWISNKKKTASSVKLLVSSYLFTGDAMFSGGGGVAFESDLEFPRDLNPHGKTVHSRFKPNAGTLSIERCFAQVLRRSLLDTDAQQLSSHDGVASHQVMIFPGHEYTFELLHRQMSDNGGTFSRISQWGRHQPSVFFELASQYFIAGHRRNLPKSTRLLTIPSTMKRELKVNPYFRSLKKRGEHIITSIVVWYNLIYKPNAKMKNKSSRQTKGIKGDADFNFLTMPMSEDDMMLSPSLSMNSEKTLSSQYTWNLDYLDYSKSTFTTVYTSDLQQIIYRLQNNKISAQKAAMKLSTLHLNLEESTVLRRPIPNTISNDKQMFMGLLALAVLGSEPSGLSSSDSDIMNIPLPVASSDHLLISKSRLISTLFRLGLLSTSADSDHTASDIVKMIDLLWDDVRTADAVHDSKLREDTDLEIPNKTVRENDVVELGALKLSLYAVTYRQPSWFQKYCMPCSRSDPKDTLKRSGGELVKHDTMKCKMCLYSLGCPQHDDDRFIGEEQNDDLSIDMS